MVPAVGTDGTVAVEGGTLRVQAADLDGAAVSVAAGARLELDAGRVTNATVSVAAGGAFSVGAGMNLIPSDAADFEQVDITQATDAFQKANGFWQVSPVCGWTFEMLGDQTAFSGVQRDGGVMSPAGWKWTPSGRQTAFLRSNNRMSRTVEVPEDGVYEISGAWIDNLVGSIFLSEYESRMYFERTLRKAGVFDRLEAMGIREHDIVRVADVEFEYIF